MRVTCAVAISLLGLCAASTSFAGGGLPDTYVSGLLHTPLGGAELGPVDGRRLPVHNLGSSGEDGVEVSLSSAFGGGAEIDLQPLMSTAGASFRIRHKGWDGLIYGSHRLASNGDGTGMLTCDYSDMGATGVQIVKHDARGVVTFSGTYPGPIADFPLDNQIFYCPPGTIPVAGVWHGRLCNTCPWITVFVFYCDGVMYTENLVITPILPVGTPDSPGIESMMVTGSGIPELTVANAHVRTFDMQSWGLGSAQISEQCDNPAGCTPAERKLHADNLGSSGLDGVAIALPPSNGGVSLEYKRRVPPGHVTLMKRYDEAGRVLHASRTLIDELAGIEELDADFTALGASGFHLTLFDDSGVVVGPPGGTDAINGGGRPYFTNRCLVGQTEWWILGGTQSNPVWIFQGCIGGYDFVLPDGSPVPEVSSFRVEPVGATSSFGPLVRCDVLSDDPAGLIIDGIVVVPYVSGLLHKPIGDAQFGSLIDSRRLPVHNLGSSGEDGVEIQLSSAFGGGAEIDLEPFLSTPGAEFRHKHKGWDGLIYGNHRMVSNGDGSALLTLDYSDVGATSILIEQLDANGHVISSAEYAGPIVDLPLNDVVFTCPPNCIKTWRIWTGQLCSTCPVFSQILYTCTCPNGETNDYSERRITPTFPPGTPDNPGFESLSITGSGLPELVVSNAHIRTFNLPSWGLGTAQISEVCDNPLGCTPDERKLHADNLGSSGQDGVAVALPPNNGGASLALSRPRCCRGHVIIMKAFDDEGQEMRVSRTQTLDLDGTEVLDADFSDLGATGFRLTLLDGSGVVIGPPGGTEIIYGGPRPYFTNHCPPGSRKLWTNVGPPAFTVWIFQGCAGDPYDFVLPGGTTVPNVSSFRVEPLGATLSFGSRVRCEITSNDDEGLVIEDIVVAPAVCHGDCDCDGSVGFTDIDYFVESIPDNQAAWAALYAARHSGAAPTCSFANCDIDGNGHVGFSDIDPFVNLIPSACP